MNNECRARVTLAIPKPLIVSETDDEVYIAISCDNLKGDPFEELIRIGELRIK